MDNVVENTESGQSLNSSLTQHKKGFFATLFGHFASVEFWKDLVSTMAREAITSCLTAFGGVIIYAVQKRITPDSKNIRSIIDNRGTPTIPVSGPASGYANGYTTPQPSYRPSYPSPLQGVQSTPTYPGFGNHS